MGFIKLLCKILKPNSRKKNFFEKGNFFFFFFFFFFLFFVVGEKGPKGEGEGGGEVVEGRKACLERERCGDFLFLHKKKIEGKERLD